MLEFDEFKDGISAIQKNITPGGVDKEISKFDGKLYNAIVKNDADKCDEILANIDFLKRLRDFISWVFN